MNTCTTPCSDDVSVTSLKNAVLAVRKRNAKIRSASTVSPNSPDLNPVDYSVLGTLQEKVYKTCMTDLDDLEHYIRTEWAKLDHAVIAAAVHQ